jgi:ubiquitin carboxyl-terminal hydrolase 1
VCHYGQHSFGHYICYRRKPRHPSLGTDNRWAPPKIIDPIRSDEDSSTVSADGDIDSDSMEGSSSRTPRYVFGDDVDYRPGKGWLRISDDAVRECGIEAVLQEGMGAFMLYYERAVLDVPGIYSSGNGSPRSSEETLKPELRTVNLNGSAASLVSEVGVGIRHPHPQTYTRPQTGYTRGHQSWYDESAVTGLSTSVNLDLNRGRSPATPTSGVVGLSASLSQSQMLSAPGARIVRNVTTRRSRSAASQSRRSSTENSTPMREVTGDVSRTSTMTLSTSNGMFHELSASTPALVQHHQPSHSQPSSPSSTSKLKQKSKPLSSSSPSRTRTEVPRVHSPQSHHPHNGTPTLHLKA